MEIMKCIKKDVLGCQLLKIENIWVSLLIVSVL